MNETSLLPSDTEALEEGKKKKERKKEEEATNGERRKQYPAFAADPDSNTTHGAVAGMQIKTLKG